MPRAMSTEAMVAAVERLEGAVSRLERAADVHARRQDDMQSLRQRHAVLKAGAADAIARIDALLATGTANG